MIFMHCDRRRNRNNNHKRETQRERKVSTWLVTGIIWCSKCALLPNLYPFQSTKTTSPHFRNRVNTKWASLSISAILFENSCTEIPYWKSTITKLSMLPDSSTSSSSLELLSKIQAPLCLSSPAPALGLRKIRFKAQYERKTISVRIDHRWEFIFFCVVDPFLWGQNCGCADTLLRAWSRHKITNVVVVQLHFSLARFIIDLIKSCSQLFSLL
jgi:hypothetical protein